MIIRDTSISGSLAANCPTDSVLGNLLQLHIETSPVTGLVPDCVMSLSSLSLIHTDIGGALPAIPTSSPLKVLELVQVRPHVPPCTICMHTGLLIEKCCTFAARREMCNVLSFHC